MAEPAVLDILNELLAAEQGGLPERMFESTVFISRLSVDESRDVERMARMSREHAAWLSDLILELGGTLGPRVCDMASADLHYQELHNVVPRLLRAQEKLISLYAAATKRVESEPKARDLIDRIRSRHQGTVSLLGACAQPEHRAQAR